jgi:predicted dehydrogenase
VDEMATAAKQNGVVIAEAFMYRHHPQTIKVEELVKNGAIGKLGLVRGSFTFKLTQQGDVRMDASLGGGSIWDIGCYPISYTRFLAGKNPLEVIGWQVRSSRGVDETFVGQMRFVEGVFGQFDCGFHTPFRAQLELVGSEGSIQVPAPFAPRLNETIQLKRGDEVQIIQIPGQELYLGEVEDMADAILHGRPTRVSLEDSRGNVATIVALLESSQSGQPVQLD